MSTFTSTFASIHIYIRIYIQFLIWRFQDFSRLIFEMIKIWWFICTFQLLINDCVNNFPRVEIWIENYNIFKDPNFYFLEWNSFKFPRASFFGNVIFSTEIEIVLQKFDRNVSHLKLILIEIKMLALKLISRKFALRIFPVFYVSENVIKILWEKPVSKFRKALTPSQAEVEISR